MFVFCTDYSYYDISIELRKYMIYNIYVVQYYNNIKHLIFKQWHSLKFVRLL